MFASRLFGVGVPAILVFVCFAGQGQAATGPNPAYLAWKSFKPGTAVRVENSTDPRIIRYKTARLISVTADAAMVEFSEGKITADGTDAEKPQVVRIRATTYISESTTQPTGVTTQGDEQITVAGRKVQAHWIKTVTIGPDRDRNNEMTTRTEWTSAQVPGGLAIDQWTTESSTHIRQFAWKIVEIKEPD